MNHVVISFIVALMLLCRGASAETDHADKKPEAMKDPVQAERYRVVDTAHGTLLVDTASGHTWLLTPHEGKLAWLPIERLDSFDKLRTLGAKITLRDGVPREIDLTDSVVTDQDLEAVGKLASLEQVILDGCSQLTDEGLKHLGNLKSLTGLAIERTAITDAGLAHSLSRRRRQCDTRCFS